MKKAYHVLWVLLPILGLLLGAAKILAFEVEVRTFNAIGYGAWFRPAVGAAQAIFGLLIAIPATQLIGVALSILLLAMMAVLMALSGLGALALVPCLGMATLCLFAWARREAKKKP